MTLHDLIGRIIERNHAPPAGNGPVAIFDATRGLVGLHYWMTRPTPFYTAEFFAKRRPQHGHLGSIVDQR